MLAAAPHALKNSLAGAWLCPESPTGFDRRATGRTVGADNRKFVGKILSRHRAFAPALRAGYLAELARSGARLANLCLLTADARLTRDDLRLSMSDQESRDWCAAKARLCDGITLQNSVAGAVEKITALLDRYGIAFPAQNDLFGRLESGLQRCASEKWWRNAVNRLRRRECDEVARAMRLVNASCQRFCSDYTVQEYRSRKVRNRNLLAEMIATNQYGDWYTLAELADLSVSDPEIRRCELMMRCNGFEQVANASGHVAEFYTLTCPSKFHPFSKGRPNAKYNGSSVGEAQAHLNGVWRRVRASLCRAGLRPYGFRVVEPHHDGTPHWHFLLFMAPADADRVRGILREHALQVDGKELGANDHRFQAVRVDPTKGSATGYIAKYIAKNVNGFGLGSQQRDLPGLGGDDYVEDSAGAERVVAWASAHRVRQFQQIGGPCVSVWRELRRLAFEDSTDEVEPFREAADAADWAAFVMLMGGPSCGRQQSLRLQWWHEFDADTGELLDAIQGRYGDFTRGKVIGLKVAAQVELPVVCTRLYRWVIGRLSGSMNLLVRAGSEFFDFSGAHAPPWTRVNNCTAGA